MSEKGVPCVCGKRKKAKEEVLSVCGKRKKAKEEKKTAKNQGRRKERQNDPE